MNQTTRKIDWARYGVTLVITVLIFISAFYLSDILASKKISEIRNMQDSIAIDLLSSETQFSLLRTATCSEDGYSILAPEIAQLGTRLASMESQLGATNNDVIGLKKYYSLLQIKDYMLTQELVKNCNFKPLVMVYFYSPDCAECEKQGYVLTALREKYPLVRIYAFDAQLDLSAIKTLQTVLKAPSETPSLVVKGKVLAGFQTLESLETLLQKELQLLEKEQALREEEN
jgi:hypothetical protein